MAGKTILIIEDDTIHREALAAGLRPHGFRVLAVPDGNEARNRLANGPAPDLILLDMLLHTGEYDGWWFLGHRQHTPALASAPVVIMTSLSVACEAWAVSLGAAGLLRKPLDIESLLAKIRDYLREPAQA